MLPAMGYEDYHEREEEEEAEEHGESGEMVGIRRAAMMSKRALKRVWVGWGVSGEDAGGEKREGKARAEQVESVEGCRNV